MTPTIDTISVVCLTEDQEDGDLILDLMVDGINMVSYTVAVLCFDQCFFNHTLGCNCLFSTQEYFTRYPTGYLITL
jgi:hypothetical protein